MTKTPTPASHAVNTAPISAAAWMTPDGDRVVTETTMAGARKDGGAMLSSLRPYTVALVRADARHDAPAAQPSRECLQQSAADNLHAAIMNLPCEASASHFLMKAERNAYRQGHKEARHAAAELAAALQAAPPAPAGVAVPDGFALVPKRLTPAMERVLCADEEGWQWEDLLAAAEAITEQEYAALAAAPAQAVAVPEGYVLVPKKLSAELIYAALAGHYGKRRLDAGGGPGGMDMTVNDNNYSGTAAVRRMWRGLVSALPPAPAAPAQEHATQLAGPVLHDIEAGTEVMAWLRENRAPHSIYSKMSACLFGDPDAPRAQPAAPVQAQEDARDAARYRWLRDEQIGDDPIAINLPPAGKRGLDAAVDMGIKRAARAAQGGAA